jgi:hypothetical protein
MRGRAAVERLTRTPRPAQTRASPGSSGLGLEGFMNVRSGTAGRAWLAMGTVAWLCACSSSTAPGSTTTATGAGGAGTTATVWTECPPQGAAPDGGQVTESTYAGQACSGALKCSWLYGDCPDLTGYGPSCDCVGQKLVCTSHSCSSSTGGGGHGGAGGGHGGAGGAGGAK